MSPSLGNFVDGSHPHRTQAFGQGKVALTEGIPDEFAGVLTKDAAFPKRMGRPEEYAKLAVAIVENPMLNGLCIRLDGGQRFAPK